VCGVVADRVEARERSLEWRQIREKGGRRNCGEDGTRSIEQALGLGKARMQAGTSTLSTRRTDIELQGSGWACTANDISIIHVDKAMNGRADTASILLSITQSLLPTDTLVAILLLMQAVVLFNPEECWG